MSKKTYVTPEMTVFGTVEMLTRGPNFINTNDNWSGNADEEEGEPINVGCWSGSHPVEQHLCSYTG